MFFLAHPERDRKPDAYRLFDFLQDSSYQDCEEVLLENFTIDFAFPRYAIATVEQIDAEGMLPRVDAQRFPFEAENG